MTLMCIDIGNTNIVSGIYENEQLIDIKRIDTNINAIDEQLLQWRKSSNSLSSSTFRKLVDGYNVYRKYLNYGILKSIYCLFVLSVNFLRKK